MTGGRGVVDRRTVLRGFGALGLAAVLAGCSSAFAGTRLTLATGGTQGVYYIIGSALGEAWQADLGLDAPPVVRSTAGSVDNLGLLAAGAADVAFCQVDAAVEHLAHVADGDRLAPRALARVYDEFVHVVVPAASPVTSLAGLRGARVSIGAPESGVSFVARRLLEAASISPETDLRAVRLSINDSVTAMREGTIDAFFWTGGLPTTGVTDLSATMPIRLLDLTDVLGAVREIHPEYAPGTVPASMYGLTDPITTFLVRNFLLVPAGMSDDLAYALVETIFKEQEKLALASPAALTIDLRAAIGTQPVPLHPGAERYFRAAKNS